MYRQMRAGLVLILLYAAAAAWSQKPHVINFDREAYGAANKNWAISRDTSGIMYFGNDKGLLEFDGIRWKLHTLAQAPVMRSVSASNRNMIFTGGYEEFGFWQRNSLNELHYTSLSRNLKKGTELHNDDIWKILVTDSVVYFQSFGHIYEYDYHTVKVMPVEGFPILFLMQVYDESFAQKMGKGLCRLTRRGLEDIPGSELLNRTEVRFMLPYAGGRYLVGTSTMGLFVYDGKSFSAWESEFSKSTRSYQLNNGILTAGGRYFFGTILNGIYETDAEGKIINHFSSDNFLQDNTVLALYEDHNHNLWAALDRGISYLCSLPRTDCYTDRSGKMGAVYAAALFNNKLFLGTNRGVFFMPYHLLNTPKSLWHLQPVPDTQGQIWDLKVIGNHLLCGHNNGLIVIDKDYRAVLHKQPGIYNINTAERNKQEVLLLGTYTSAVIASARDYTVLHRPDTLREPIIRVETDHLGNIWLQHAEKGVYQCRFTQGETDARFVKAYGGETDDGLPFKLQLFKMGMQVIFYGNRTFYTYNDIEDKIVEYPKLNAQLQGLEPLQKIVCLTPELYLAASNKCIYKLHYEAGNLRIADKYDIGLGNLSLVNGYENIIALNDSLALTCLDNGFLLHRLQESSQADAPLSPPVIRSVLSFNTRNEPRSVDFTDATLSLAYNQSSLLFDFYAREVLPRNLRFQYCLEGAEYQWSELEKVHEARFERLPRGRYRFLVRTADNLGNVSEPASVSFRVRPPWYASGAAYACYMVLLPLLVTGVYFGVLRHHRNRHLLRVRMREEQRLRRQNQDLQKAVEEKDAELRNRASIMIQNSPSTVLEEDWTTFLIRFEQTHPDFFKRMRELQPDLTQSELRLCACLKINLSSKDIASLMSISLRAVENSRYRLRKKLNIPPGQNLYDYFSGTFAN